MHKPWQYILVDTVEKYQKMVTDLDSCERLGLDTESSGPSIRKYTKRMAIPGKMVNMYHPATTLSGISLAHTASRRSWYVPKGHSKGNLPIVYVNALERLLEGKECWIHNIPHEMKALSLKEKPPHWYDTIILLWVMGRKAGKKGYGLKDATPYHLEWNMSSFNEVVGQRVFSELTPEEGLAYACEDAIAAAQLADRFYPELKKHDVQDVFYTEMEYVEVFHSCELAGMPLDVEGTASLEERLSTRSTELFREWNKLAPNRKVAGVWQQTVPQLHAPPETDGRWTGKNWVSRKKAVRKVWPVSPTSSDQLQSLFTLGIWPKDEEYITPATKEKKQRGETPKVTFQVGATALEYYMELLPEKSQGHALAAILAEKKTLDKNLSSFTRGYIVAHEDAQDGRVHTSFLQHGTETGRASSSSPNLMQVPTRTKLGKEVRALFKATPGSSIIVADYGQLEYRVGADYCKKGYLWECFQKGIDPHGATMEIYSIPRDSAKSFNFCGYYGGGPAKLASIIDCSLAEGKDIHARLMDQFSEEQLLMKRIKKAVRERGWVKSKTGFKRWLPDALLRCHEKHGRANPRWDCDTCFRISRAERQAANHVIQSTGAGITKRAMLLWHRSKVQGTVLMGQVHDELLVQAWEDEEHAARYLEQCMVQAARDVGLVVPMSVDAGIGDSWATAKG